MQKVACTCILLGLSLSMGSSPRADETRQLPDDVFHACTEYGKKKQSSPVDQFGGHCGGDGFYYDRFGGHYDEFGYQYKDGSYKSRCAERYDIKSNKIFEDDGSERKIPPYLKSPKDRRALVFSTCAVAFMDQEARKTSHPSGQEPSRPAGEAPPPQVVDAAQALRPLLFATGTFRLKNETADQRSLQAIAAFLALRRDVTKLAIEGHTNSTGTEEASQALSRLRAATVKTSLVQMGVHSDRLQEVGFGNHRPIADNSTASGRALNDRVEFRIAETNGIPTEGDGPTE